MEIIKYQYNFTFDDGTKKVFDCNLDASKIVLIDNIPENLPDWTRLDFCQCGNCPLDVKTVPHCPLAANIVNIVIGCDGLLSYDRVHLDVVIGDKTISQETSIQSAISSFMGLIIGASGCPHVAFFKPMARFHFPLAKEKDTIYRSVANYLLAQYFVKMAGQSPDFELKGLEEIYINMQEVNTSIAERLRSASKTDSTVNAIVVLDMFAMILPIAIKNSLKDIRVLFDEYLDGMGK